MKNKLLLFSLFLYAQAGAQLQVGQGSLTLFGGTTLRADKLTLIPSGRFDITNNAIEQSSTAVSLNGTVYSIHQIYTFRTPMVFSGTVRLFFDPAALNGHAVEDLKLSYKSGGVWRYAAGTVLNTTHNYLDEVVTARTFDALTASAPYITLPVTLLSFTATWQPGNRVLLQWQTAAEVNNSHFTLERSGDGRHFAPLTTVKAAASGGPSVYSFTDGQPLGGTGYYRLRQHDRDGQSRLYAVRAVQPAHTGTPTLYPNPVTGGGFTLDLKKAVDQPLRYTISTAGGQVVQSGRLQNQREWIATPTLTAGTYLLQLSNGQTLPFQKQ